MELILRDFCLPMLVLSLSLATRLPVRWVDVRKDGSSRPDSNGTKRELRRRIMEEQKGQVYADKCVTLVRWLLRSSEQYYAGNHVIYGSADRNLERIHRLFENLLCFALRSPVGPPSILLSGCYLRRQVKVPFKSAKTNRV